MVGVRNVLTFAAVASRCLASDQHLKSYYASLNEIGSSGASGNVAVFVTNSGLLLGAGMASGLEPDLRGLAMGGSNCTAKNGCGAHIHSGSACDNSSVQGGHYFNASDMADPVDPWAIVRYAETDNVGNASFVFSLNIGTGDIGNKPFIIHSADGARVACGLLSEVQSELGANAMLTPLGSSDAMAEVTVFTMADLVFGAGIASGLQSSLLSEESGGENCTAKNGCGAHVHSGDSCANSTTQGGHYFEGLVDPWAPVQYTSTNGVGGASFAFMIRSSATDIVGKPFILHNDAGGRVSCGILMAAEMNVSTSVTAGSTSMADVSTTSVDVTTTVAAGTQESTVTTLMATSAAPAATSSAEVTAAAMDDSTMLTTTSVAPDAALSAAFSSNEASLAALLCAFAAALLL